MNDVKCNTKGFSLMYDIAPRQGQEVQPIPVSLPTGTSLAQQLVAFLHLLLSSERSLAPPPARHKRGAPAKLSTEQLCLALLKGVLSQAAHLSMIWRSLVLEPTGSFPPVHISYEAVRKRLQQAGPALLQQCFEALSQALAQWVQGQQRAALSLAPFASAVLALDETTLDALRRLTADLRDLPAKDPHLLPGKLAGLFDLRAQRWVRLQFRADVLAGCNVGILLLLEGLAPGSLILADLGYFSFPWFDYLTQQGFFWVSRLKAGATYQIQQVLAYDDSLGQLDAIVWLGKHRADRAGHAVRLVIFCWQGQQYRYLTNVLDPALLSVQDIAQLYARRWDIELAFKLLKRELGLHLWWGARPELVLSQLWVALMLAQLLHGLQLTLAWQAGVDPFEVSMHLLVELLPLLPAESGSLLELLSARGRELGLLRPSSRLHRMVPAGPPQRLPALPVRPPCPRHARYNQRNPHPRTAPFVSPFLTQLLI